MEISELLKNIIRFRLRDKFPEIDKMEIKPQYLLYTDLGIDSLDVMEIIMTAENNLNVKIPDEQVHDINTFEDLCNLFKNATEK